MARLNKLQVVTRNVKYLMIVGGVFLLFGSAILLVVDTAGRRGISDQGGVGGNSDGNVSIPPGGSVSPGVIQANTVFKQTAFDESFGNFRIADDIALRSPLPSADTFAYPWYGRRLSSGQEQRVIVRIDRIGAQEGPELFGKAFLSYQDPRPFESHAVSVKGREGIVYTMISQDGSKLVRTLFIRNYVTMHTVILNQDLIDTTDYTDELEEIDGLTEEIVGSFRFPEVSAEEVALAEELGYKDDY